MKKTVLILLITTFLAAFISYYFFQSNQVRPADLFGGTADFKSSHFLKSEASLIEKKKKAVEMILLSKAIYDSNDWGNLLNYISVTNDQGESSDFEGIMGMNLEQAFAKLEKGELQKQPLYVLGAPILNNPQIYSYLTEDYFYNNFQGIKGASVLEPRFDELWDIYYSSDFKGTSYLLAIFGFLSNGKLRPGLCTFGAFHKDSGEFRALPVAAFSIQ